MSLINQVLNDLEKRGASTNIGEATVRVVPYKREMNPVWLLIGAAIILAGGVAAGLIWSTQKQPAAPPDVVATEPVQSQIQQASHTLAATTAAVEKKPLVAAIGGQDVTAPAGKAALSPLKPSQIMAPVIVAISPNPAISLNSAQAITITGKHFASNAKVILRKPGGKELRQFKIVLHTSTQIVVSANLAKANGEWSAEIVNDKGRFSGRFPFTVQRATALAAASAPQNKPSVAPQAKAEAVAVSAPVEAAPPVQGAGGISKQPTQITPQQQAENEYRRAYALMQQGQVAAAMTGYETVLQFDPGHIVARQTLVRLLLEGKRSAEAERVLQEGLQHDPKQTSLAMLLARIQVGRNELAKALDTMQKSLPYAQKQADYQAFVAALLQRQNRHKEAVVQFQHALQISPQSGVWQMGLGISLRADQRNAEARDAFNRALEARNLNNELQAFVTQQLKELQTETAK